MDTTSMVSSNQCDSVDTKDEEKRNRGGNSGAKVQRMRDVGRRVVSEK